MNIEKRYLNVVYNDDNTEIDIVENDRFSKLQKAVHQWFNKDFPPETIAKDIQLWNMNENPSVKLTAMNEINGLAVEYFQADDVFRLTIKVATSPVASHGKPDNVQTVDGIF